MNLSSAESANSMVSVKLNVDLILSLTGAGTVVDGCS